MLKVSEEYDIISKGVYIDLIIYLLNLIHHLISIIMFFLSLNIKEVIRKGDKNFAVASE